MYTIFLFAFSFFCVINDWSHRSRHWVKKHILNANCRREKSPRSRVSRNSVNGSSIPINYKFALGCVCVCTSNTIRLKAQWHGTIWIEFPKSQSSCNEMSLLFGVCVCVRIGVMCVLWWSEWIVVSMALLMQINQWPICPKLFECIKFDGTSRYLLICFEKLKRPIITAVTTTTKNYLFCLLFVCAGNNKHQRNS